MSRLPMASPEQVRAALIEHLARKLGYSGRAVAQLIRPLSNDAVARCLALDPETVRRALLATISARMAVDAERAP